MILIAGIYNVMIGILPKNSSIRERLLRRVHEKHKLLDNKVKIVPDKCIHILKMLHHGFKQRFYAWPVSW